MTVTTFWDVIFCTLVEVYQNLGGTWCPPSALETLAAGSFEMLVLINWTAVCHTPEGCKWHDACFFIHKISVFKCDADIPETYFKQYNFMVGENKIVQITTCKWPSCHKLSFIYTRHVPAAWLLKGINVTYGQT